MDGTTIHYLSFSISLSLISKALAVLVCFKSPLRDSSLRYQQLVALKTFSCVITDFIIYVPVEVSLDEF